VIASLIVLGIAVLAVVFVHQKAPPDKGVAGQKPPRRLVAKQWNNLMEREPDEFFWWNPTGDSHWSFDPRLQRARVQTVHTALLSLGNTNAPGYVLQLGFRQEKWSGGVGVFFGGKRTPDGRHRFHFIELRRGPLPIENSFILHRGVGEIQVVPDSEPPMTNRGITSWRLPEPPEPAEQILEIRVTRRGLESVRWNGTVCASLQDEAPGMYPNDEYQGEFGLYAQVASAQLTSGRIMPTE
jgi:hypothetical protein